MCSSGDSQEESGPVVDAVFDVAGAFVLLGAGGVLERRLTGRERSLHLVRLHAGSRA